MSRSWLKTWSFPLWSISICSLSSCHWHTEQSNLCTLKFDSHLFFFACATHVSETESEFSSGVHWWFFPPCVNTKQVDFTWDVTNKKCQQHGLVCNSKSNTITKMAFTDKNLMYTLFSPARIAIIQSWCCAKPFWVQHSHFFLINLFIQYRYIGEPG